MLQRTLPQKIVLVVNTVVVLACVIVAVALFVRHRNPGDPPTPPATVTTVVERPTTSVVIETLPARSI